MLQTINESDAYLFGPVWSPDGEWIAYSRSSGTFIADIIISRIDGSEPWQVTHTSANEIVVEWGALWVIEWPDEGGRPGRQPLAILG